jgi:hypothetical protein
MFEDKEKQTELSIFNSNENASTYLTWNFLKKKDTNILDKLIPKYGKAPLL